MKVITMYELLGMVKDGKAPKKIKYDNIIFEYDDIYYIAEHNTYLDEYCDLSRVLNDEVEILEVETLEEKKKIPEKLEEYIHTDSLNYNQCNYMFEILTNKYNEIIDYLNNKGDE